MQLVYETENQEIVNSKMSIAVYLRNFVREIIPQMGDRLTPAHLQ